MATGILLPEDVGPADAERVLGFVNGVGDASTLAATIGFSEGPAVAALLARAILDRRAVAPFTSLTEIVAVTGVTPGRFTEIVVALSGARPPRDAAANSVIVRSSVTSPLLGVGISLTVQLLDITGQGVPGAELTCVTTWGTLTARSGTAVQRGASARLVTEPGGVVSLRLDPPTAPPLSDLARAMLEAELSELARATDPRTRASALGAFAAHYRAEAADPLREAVDTLFANFQPDILTSDAGWTIIPVTLIAFAGGASANSVGLLTIPVRNWLGAFLAALRQGITDDRRIDEALVNVNVERATGERLARDIYGAQNALAGLERGILGRRFGDEIVGNGVGRFLEKNVEQIGATALIDATRIAGASSAAIMTGGFAVFETIDSFRQVEDTVGLTAQLGGRLGQFDQRLDLVEADKADRVRVEALDAQFSRDTVALDQRITTLAASQVTRADLAVLDTRIASIETTQVTRADLQAIETLVRSIERTQVTTADLGALNTRIGRLEETRVTRADLVALESRIESQLASRAALDVLGTRLDRVEATQVARADLTALNNRIVRLETSTVGQTQLTEVETRLTQRITQEVGTATTGLRTELGTRIDAKAEATSLSTLQRSVTSLQSETARISTRVEAVDTRVTTTRTIRPGS